MYSRSTLENEAKLQDSLLHYYENVQPSKGAQRETSPIPKTSTPTSAFPVSASTLCEQSSIPSTETHETGMINPTTNEAISAMHNLSEENRNLRRLLLQERQDRQQPLQQPPQEHSPMQNQYPMPFRTSPQDEGFYPHYGFSQPHHGPQHYPSYSQHPQQCYNETRERDLRSWYHNCSIM